MRRVMQKTNDSNIECVLAETPLLRYFCSSQSNNESLPLMNIAILGSGNMGTGLAKNLVKTGNTVTFGSRVPTKAADKVPGTASATYSDAVHGADVIFLALPFGEVKSVALQTGDLAGKTVVDLTNPLTADYMGLTIGHTTSAGEQVQALFPRAKVVKGFNTIFAQLLTAGPTLPGGHKVPVFLASDHVDAKKAVSALALAMGFAVEDAGPLKNARYLEPLAGLNIYFGYGAGLGTSVTPAWLRSN